MKRLAELIYESIRAEVSDALGAARATVEVIQEGDESAVILRPHNAAAASLRVALDTYRQVTCFVGDEGLPYEIVSPDSNQIVAEIKELARAVIEGQYSERVHEGNEKSKSVASWVANGRRREARYNVLRAPKPGDPNWHLITYEPY